MHSVAQLCGAVLGAGLAHAMFDLPLLQVSEKARTGAGQWLSEFAGVSPAHVPAFVAAEVVGAFAAVLVHKALR